MDVTAGLENAAPPGERTAPEEEQRVPSGRAGPAGRAAAAGLGAPDRNERSPQPAAPAANAPGDGSTPAERSARGGASGRDVANGAAATSPTSGNGNGFRAALRRAAGLLGVSLAAAGAIALGTGILALVERRAAGEAALPPAAGPAPLAVATLRLPAPARFSVEERYVGRIEPRRESRLAFERGGILAEVLVEEGARVAAGDLLARLDTRALEARRRELEARRAANEAERELAGLTLERTERLGERGHATEQERDAARLASARLAAGTAEIEAAIAQVEIALDKSALRAPFDGRVAARLADEGAILAAAAPVIELLETARPQLRVGLPESRRKALAEGAPVVVEHGGRRVEGTVAAVRPDMDPATHTVVALVDLPAMPGAAYGALARLVLERELSGEGWRLPLQALKEGRRGLWTVLVVRPPEEPGAPATAGLETVEVLAVAGGLAFVRGTLAEGDAVVVAGRHRVSRGDPVAPRPAEDGDILHLAREEG